MNALLLEILETVAASRAKRVEAHSLTLVNMVGTTDFIYIDNRTLKAESYHLLLKSQATKSAVVNELESLEEEAFKKASHYVRVLDWEIKPADKWDSTCLTALIWT